MSTMKTATTTSNGSSPKAQTQILEKSKEQVNDILLEPFPATARLTSTRRRVQSMQDLSSYTHHSSVALDADIQKSFEQRREKIEELRGARRRRSIELQRIMDGLPMVKEQQQQPFTTTTLSRKFLSVQDLRSLDPPSFHNEDRTTTTTSTSTTGSTMTTTTTKEGKPFHVQTPPLSIEELKKDLERRRKQRLELQSKVRRRSSSISSTNSESCNVIPEEEESSAMFF